MKKDLSKIKRSKIHKLGREVPYTVLYLSTKDTRDPTYDFYYMRTSSSIDKAVKKVTEEFKKKGFSSKKFEPDYNTGIISFYGKEAVIKPEKIQGMNFWVAEGLVCAYFRDKKLQVPKIRTERTATKKLFEEMHYKPHEVKEVDKSLADLLTDPERTCCVDMARVVKESSPTKDLFELEKAADRGGCLTELAIMNYGSIWGKHSTFFEDPDTEQWYQLINKNKSSKFSDAEKELFKEEYEKEMSKLSTIFKIKKFTFSEADKVNPSDSYFFDGSMKEVFEILQKEKGIRLDI